MVAQPMHCDPFTNHSARRQTVKKYNLRSKSKNGNHGLPSDGNNQWTSRTSIHQSGYMHYNKMKDFSKDTFNVDSGTLVVKANGVLPVFIFLAPRAMLAQLSKTDKLPPDEHLLHYRKT